MDTRGLINNPTTSPLTDLPHIVIDVATTHHCKGDSLHKDNRLLLTGVYDSSTLKYTSYKGNHIKLPHTLIQRLEGDVLLVGHNIKFDLRWLAKAGLDLSKVLIWDTMLGEIVILGNNPAGEPLNLNAVAGRYGLGGKCHLAGVMLSAGICPSNMPYSTLRRYCKQDVRLTLQIFLKQRTRIIGEGKMSVMLTRCLLTPVLADIETKGLCLDGDLVTQEYHKEVGNLNNIHVQLKGIADINYNSSQQKAELLYATLKFKELSRRGAAVRTATGAPKADLDTIKRLKATNKKQRTLQALLVEQSKCHARLTKTLGKFKQCVDDGSLLYAKFNQHLTKTHRLSSSGTVYRTQLQNIAREFKGLFVAREEGWDVVEADGANLEFRVAVELGQDEQGRIDIANPDFDAHTTTAQVLTDAGQPTTRQEAKAHTFKPLFGGMSGTSAEKAYYREFLQRYKGIASVQERWKFEALRSSRVKMAWGMEFFYPDTKLERGGYQSYSTQICNYPIQSLATADIIPIALIGQWHDMRYYNMRSFIVNTVHDSTITESPADETDKLNEIIVRNFTEVCYNYLNSLYNMEFKTPLGVNITRGCRWSEGESLSFT